MSAPTTPPALARLSGVTLRYRDRVALDAVDLELPGGCSVGLIGADGVGKSSLLALIAGVRRIQHGRVEVLGADLARRRGRDALRQRIAYMPQGLGRNLYPTLSITDNLDFFGRLRGYSRARRARRVDALLDATGLAPFRARRVGQLSGGMKQKLGLCCALMHDPDLLVLDEPTTGVDPLSRSQFWQLIERVRAQRPGLSLLVATAYLDEAEGFDWVVAMDRGRVLDAGAPEALRARRGAPTLDAAFVALLREHETDTGPMTPSTPRTRAAAGPGAAAEVAIEARGLTRRFGDFVAVDHVDLRIERGEIFGFIGSNGCGKTTTMKMLTGLLPASAGSVRVLGREPDARDTAARARVGYMTQTFSLYDELTVAQNLALHARLFALPPAQRTARIDALIDRFGLRAELAKHPHELPLGMRQRLSLAVATLHGPELLILDEPTSGVDPLARDAFWRLMTELARDDGVTLFVSTHLMGEAMRCDRVALMHAGRIVATGAPQALADAHGGGSLERAFVALLRDEAQPQGDDAGFAPAPPPRRDWRARLRARALGVYSFSRRETLELLRDPVRATLALVGSALLLLIMGYGISMDVENLRFAVLDRDATALSRDYAGNIAGSRYFVARAPITDDAELQRRMRSGELSLAIEIPPHFARDAARGRGEIGAWVDGAMPARAETIDAYVAALHAQWLLRREATAAPGVETRFRYNPDVRSAVAMVPAVIPLLLMMIPAMLTSLSVVREKELGSIVNFYLAPVGALEFLVGKQLPYAALAMLNFALLWLLAVTAFDVPFKGSAAALLLAAALYVAASTALGLLMSTFLRTQTAAIFATTLGTMLPAIQFSGLLNPTSSLEGAAAWIGRAYPTTHFLDISRGTFSKALGFADLGHAFVALALAAPLLVLLSAALLRKQER
jgi:ribosome-dependent ATPase